MTTGIYPEIKAGQRVTSSLLRSMRPQFAYKTADESRSSTTTLTADGELFIPVEANAKYLLTGFLITSQNNIPAAGFGFRVGWYGPTGATLSWSSYGTSSQTTATTYDVTVNSITQTRDWAANGTTFMSGAPQGSLEVGSTSGTFGVRWSQVASSGTATFMRAKSWIRLERIL